MNRKQFRYAHFHKPTKLQVLMTNLGKVVAYLHPTKGYRGNKKAIKEYRKKNGYK